MSDAVPAQARLDAAGAALLAGVDAHLAPYLVTRARRVLDAWGQRAHRPSIDERLALAADAGARRAARELRALVATDAAEQRVTPLQVVRRATTEVTAVLADAGVPAVARDEHEERIAPDDRYDLAPRAFADLDADLGPAQLAWGAAKAAVLRAAHRRGDVSEVPSDRDGTPRPSLGRGREDRR